MRSKFLLLVYPLLLVGLLTAFWVETVVATIIDSRSQSSITPHPSILLTGFTATVAADHQIRLQWVSEYEGEFLGFNLYRYEKREKDSSIKRSEEHTSELQSRPHLVCRLLLEKKKKK